MFRFNRKTFFDGYRKAFGPVQQLQVDGLNSLLGTIEADPKWESIQQLAYFLATIKHETGITRNGVYQAFQPIREQRAKAGTKGRKNQDRYWLSGYYGRGYIQLTWRGNYDKFGIANAPDKALEAATAYRIAAEGMRGGKFTGKKLGDYINDSEVDYVNARRIVNGLDRANDIAFIAEKFERILRASVKEAAVAEEEKKAPAPSVTQPITELSPQPDKGETTGGHSTEVAGTPPPAPAVEVKASEVPFWTRITSLSIPAGIMTVIGGIVAAAKELPPYAWIAFSLIAVAAMVIGYMIYRDSKKEAHERTKIVLTAAADPDKNNLRLV